MVDKAVFLGKDKVEMKKLVSSVLSLSLVLLLLSPVSAAKPDNPGKGNGGGNDDFVPIPNSVCIDPGHGGDDTGAVNKDLLEKDVNLEVANKLRALLEDAGYTVFQTRTDDSTLSNADRYNYCNSERAAILISIHHNGSSDPSVDYSLALYFKKEDKDLARIVVDTVSSQLGLANKGIDRFASGVLLKSKMPATISEAFFLTNDTEYDLIKKLDRLDQEAKALFDATEAYFSSN